jgi:hypothetical protein
MEKVKIEQKNIERINKCLGRINDINSSSTTGHIHIFQYPIYEVNIRIIAGSLLITGIDSIEYKQRFIRSVCEDFNRNKKKLSIENFVSEIDKKIVDFYSNPFTKFYILSPINIINNAKTKFSSVKVLDENVIFSNWDSIEDKFNLVDFFKSSAKFITQTDDVKNFYQDFLPLEVEIFARDFYEAFEKSLPILDFLRGFLNFSLDLNRIRYFKYGRAKPLGKILPPPTYGIFDNQGNYLHLALTMREYETLRFVDLKDNKLNELKQELEKFNSIPEENQTKFLWIESIQKYCEAMDAIEERLAFLNFWQILEILSLKLKFNENINMKNTINRINVIIGKEEILKDLLNVIYDCRNSLVHEGKYPDSEILEEVMFIKMIVDFVLIKFLSMTETFKTINELNCFYKYSTKSHSDLNLMSNVLKKIKQNR